VHVAGIGLGPVEADAGHMHQAAREATEHEGEDGNHAAAQRQRRRQHAGGDQEGEVVRPDHRMADAGGEALPQGRGRGAAHRMMGQGGQRQQGKQGGEALHGRLLGHACSPLRAAPARAGGTRYICGRC